MRRLALLFWLALSLAANLAHAETYPSRPITLLVPAAAGGGNDTVARVVAEKMGKLLGQQIVIENRPGAGGSLAARQVARSEPDGYTIGIGNPAVLAIAPAMLPNVGYDPVKDFAPVGMIAASPHIILINNSIPAKTLAEFIALAKAEPGRYTFASGGAGSPAHLGPELLASIAGIKLTHVPYKGTGPAIADLLGGHVSMTYSSLPPAIGLVREGKVRPIAIASPKRSALLPDVPTASETLPGYEFDAALRHRCAGRHTACDPREAQCGFARGPRCRRGEIARRSRGRRDDPGVARGIRRRYCGGGGEVGKGHHPARSEGRSEVIRT